MLPLGQVFAGRYRPDKELGRGSYGVVYRATHVETEASVALKVLQPIGTSEEHFVVEAKVAARTNSEHIVQVFDAGLDATTGLNFIAMELLVGKTLEDVVRSERTRTPSELSALIQQVASGLDKAHSWIGPRGERRPIVHRDLKPENLFLTQRADGTPLIKILDFGIAKVVSATRPGTQPFKGTPIYMAPEQISGSVTSPQTDIWALGLIAFFLLTGKSYWKVAQRPDGSFPELLHEVQIAPLVAPSTRCREVGAAVPTPLAFDAWFARCVARDPTQRFGTAGACAIALQDALGTATRRQPTARVIAIPATPDQPAAPSLALAPTEPQQSKALPALEPVDVAFHVHNVVEQGDRTFVLGYLENRDTSVAENVTLRVTLRDAARLVVHIEDDSAADIHSHSKAPVRIRLVRPPAHADVDVQVTARRGSPSRPLYSSIVATLFRPRTEGLDYLVAGRLQNDGKEPAEVFTLCLLAFNGRGKLIEMAYIQYSALLLLPGTRTYFTASVRLAEVPAKLEVWHQARLSQHKPAAAAAAVFEQHRKVMEKGPTYMLLGMIMNTSDSWVTHSAVNAVLVDQFENDVDVRTQTVAFPIAPRGSAPVVIQVEAAPSHAKVIYEAKVVGVANAPMAIEKARVTITRQVGDGSSGVVEVSGRVYNGSNALLSYPRIGLAAFDTYEKLVGFGDDYVVADTLLPGQSSKVLREVRGCRTNFRPEGIRIGHRGL